MAGTKDLRQPIPLEKLGGSHQIPNTNFEILKYIGSGASSLCYRAQNKESKEYVIIKEWYPYEFANEECFILQRDGADLVLDTVDEECESNVKYSFKESFKNEISTSCNIRYIKDGDGNNNDLTVFGCFEVSKELSTWSKYLVINTFKGEVLKQKTFASTEDILKATQRILERVQELHNKGYLHLDLKPENIYVTDASIGDLSEIGNHIFILLDYGSSLKHQNGQVDSSEINAFTSTTKYAAPELLNADAENINFSTDVYSVIKIMMELFGFESDVINLTHAVTNNHYLGELPLDFQKMFISLFYDGICTRKFKKADDLNKELTKILNILHNKGIDPNFISLRSNIKCEEEKAIIEDTFPGDIEVITAEE